MGSISYSKAEIYDVRWYLVCGVLCLIVSSLFEARAADR